MMVVYFGVVGVKVVDIKWQIKSITNVSGGFNIGVGGALHISTVLC